jgi:signal transduction histidine kinase/CheY-like chemotaxis protein
MGVFFNRFKRIVLSLRSRLHITHEWESDFLLEYRSVAIRWTGYASLAGAVLFFAFWVRSVLGEPHTFSTQVVRLGLMVFLTGVGFFLIFKKKVSVYFYLILAALTCSVVLGGRFVVLMLSNSGGVGGEDLFIKSLPGAVVEIFVCYTLLRLPIYVSGSIGVSTFVLVVIGAPIESGSNDAFRAGLYLLLANVFGALISIVNESRERALFHQRREAEAARQEARERQARAEEADRQKTRLIAAVSHDLRQPMMAAVAYLETVRQRLQRHDLAGADAQAERTVAAIEMLGATLDHLLTAARYDSGTEALSIEPVPLAPLLDDLTDAYEPEAKKRGIRLRVRGPRERLALVTDARSIHRVLSNLLANAVKFTDPRPDGVGGVLLAVRRRGERCRIDVMDTGIGMNPEAQAEIWKPFVQLNNIERDRERGLGLGLFLVQRIIEQLPGHTVSMRTQAGRGSVFSIELPMQELGTYGLRSMRRSVQLVAPNVDVSPLRGARVLVLEDDRDTRDALLAMLADWGVMGVAAATLEGLMNQPELRGRDVAAVICDYKLSGRQSGLTAIAGVRAVLGPALPAALITGEPDVAPLRALAGPSILVLQKPFSPPILALWLLKHASSEERPNVACKEVSL